MESEEGVTVIKRSEIDTRPPFRSVKEAVTLFGEKVLAGELYANKLKEMRLEGTENGRVGSEFGIITAELEETKQVLEKAKEESMAMADCISSLKEELERTKRELQQLKERKTEKQVRTEPEEEAKITVKAPMRLEGVEFQRKRYVTFANPPALVAQVRVPPGVETLERHPSLRKKKKKPLIPLIGGIFSKKKGGGLVVPPREAHSEETKRGRDKDGETHWKSDLHEARP
ncbi:hypothetical protein K2173_007558 [Erythroxylum novogranatense]|uniref:WEB family protein n=1 Tax=Erythroxylum novogranatense TaxID=1862640 RepID=A0AAV8T888_9ROSI|nr:hypothetical protein K2173_007558 [Erythroxylum novogranatense]